MQEFCINSDASVDRRVDKKHSVFNEGITDKGEGQRVKDE